MYAVVGCTDCGALWLLKDARAAETATCPRCGRTHQTKKLRRFVEEDDREAARQARAALLAKRGGNSAAFAETAHVAEMERDLNEHGVGETEYLEGSGLDATEVEAAGERASKGTQTGSSGSQIDVVRDALRECDAPTADDVAAYAEARGVAGERARDLLTKLTRRGEASESRGTYRLL
ncbi:replication protein H [Halobellus sp. Atlit-31R]|nr:replication protein H [Halobellus sp. Atlit-31R]